MATASQYLAQPTLETSVGGTANTALDGTGTLVVASQGVGTAAVGVGKRINRVRIEATGATSGGLIRFFVSTDNGVTNRLFTDVVVTAATPSVTVQSFGINVSDLVGLVLPDSNARLSWCPTQANTFTVTVEAGLL